MNYNNTKEGRTALIKRQAHQIASLEVRLKATSDQLDTQIQLSQGYILAAQIERQNRKNLEGDLKVSRGKNQALRQYLSDMAHMIDELTKLPQRTDETVPNVQIPAVPPS